MKGYFSNNHIELMYHVNDISRPVNALKDLGYRMIVYEVERDVIINSIRLLVDSTPDPHSILINIKEAISEMNENETRRISRIL